MNEGSITIDADLEKNFKFAGVTFAGNWSKIIVDKFLTVAEYIEPTESELLEKNLLSMDQKWCNVHLQTSQYLTQIVKCMDKMCCLKQRSSDFSEVTADFYHLLYQLLKQA